MACEDFPAFIGQKGVKTLSLVLNASEDTIYTWRSRRMVPRAHWPELLLAYPELGLRDLLEMEAARERADA